MILDMRLKKLVLMWMIFIKRQSGLLNLNQTVSVQKPLSVLRKVSTGPITLATPWPFLHWLLFVVQVVDLVRLWVVLVVTNVVVKKAENTLVTSHLRKYQVVVDVLWIRIAGLILVIHVLHMLSVRPGFNLCQAHRVCRRNLMNWL